MLVLCFWCKNRPFLWMLPHLQPKKRCCKRSVWKILMKHSSKELAAAKYDLRVNIRFVFILIYACHGRVYSPNPPWTATVIGYVIGRSASITDVLALSLSTNCTTNKHKHADAGAYRLCKATLGCLASLCVLDPLNKCFLRYS